jgi:hypothetical protein
MSSAPCLGDCVVAADHRTVLQWTGRQVASENAALTETRTPTGTGSESFQTSANGSRATVAQNIDCRKCFGRWDRQDGTFVRLPFPPGYQSWATRPPVKATLRLAPRGLDWTRPRRSSNLIGGNGRVCFTASRPMGPKPRPNDQKSNFLLDRSSPLMEAATVRERATRDYASCENALDALSSSSTRSPSA